MKHVITILMLGLVYQTFAQKEIDVVYLKDGSRLECIIEKVTADSVFISKSEGKGAVLQAFNKEEVAVYIVNNFYATPGEELIKASGHFSAGFGLMALGGALAMVGYADSREALVYGGAGACALSLVFIYSGINSMKKAGRKIDKLEIQNDRIIFKL